jgi:hypothetical protein
VRVVSHTPAPWTIQEYGDDECPTLVLHRGETENRICFMATPGSHGDPAMIEADARLIAAAPDFANAALLALSALKNADEGDPANETGWASDESCEAYCALWKALEKAGIDPRTTNPVKQIEESAS